MPLSRGGAAIQVWLTASPVSTKLLWLHCVHPTEDNRSSRRQHPTEVLWEAVNRRGEQTELLRWSGLLGEAQATLPLQLTKRSFSSSSLNKPFAGVNSTVLSVPKGWGACRKQRQKHTMQLWGASAKKRDHQTTERSSQRQRPSPPLSARKPFCLFLLVSFQQSSIISAPPGALQTQIFPEER